MQKDNVKEIPALYRILARNIRKARIEAGMTQYEMAQRLGMSQLHYGRLERGERRASIEHVEKTAKIASVSAYALFSGCFEEFPKPCFDNSDIRETMEQLTVLLKHCTPKERELCFDLCKRVARGE